MALAAALAQLGERQTEDLKAPCSIHGGGIFFVFILLQFTRNYRLKSTKSGFSLDGWTKWYRVRIWWIISILIVFYFEPPKLKLVLGVKTVLANHKIVSISMSLTHCFNNQIIKLEWRPLSKDLKPKHNQMLEISTFQKPRCVFFKFRSCTETRDLQTALDLTIIDHSLVPDAKMTMVFVVVCVSLAETVFWLACFN